MRPRHDRGRRLGLPEFVIPKFPDLPYRKLPVAGFGLAHRAEGLRNVPATRFAIASGTKTLTAITVAELVERGRIACEMPLADCKPMPAV